MQALIDDLLAYARIGGRMASKQVDLAAVAADVRDDLAEALDGASLEVGDPARRDRRPGPAAGGPAEPGRQRRQVRPRRASLPASVSGLPGCGPGGASRWSTTGLGIAPEDRERVFEPLARAHDDVPGTGIGLATVRRIIDAHGGSIGIEETPGGGTTVWFVLPADTPEHERSLLHHRPVTYAPR